MEFTGERMVLGETDIELEIEHMSRYYFAAQFVAGKYVLDAACGTGYGSAILAHDAEKVAGIDISQESVQYAAQKYGDSHVSFQQASVESIPYPDSTFDVVVSFETLEHVSEMAQGQFLREIRRVLKPDGVLVMSTPNHTVYGKRGANTFHEKELTYTEFKCFLDAKFKYVSMFSQQWEVCDVIAGDGQSVASMRSGLPIQQAEYMIAVCSNMQIDDILSQLTVREDNRLSQLMAWAIENHERNENNNAHIIELEAEIRQYEDNLKCTEGHVELLLQRERDLQAELSAEKQRGAEECRQVAEEKDAAFLHMAETKDAEYQQMVGEKDAAYQQMAEEKDTEFRRVVAEKDADFQHMAETKDTEYQQMVEEKDAAYQRMVEEKEALYRRMTAENDSRYQKLVEESAQKCQELTALGMAKEAEWQQALRNKEGHIEQLLVADRELARIHSSRSWRWMGYIWRFRDLLAPQGSKRRLLVKIVIKFVKHPIRFLGKMSPARIGKFFYTLRREGAASVSRRLDDCMVGTDIQARAIDIFPVEESRERSVADYAAIDVPQWEHPLVSIVIPVYNQFDYTYQCIRSVVENSGEVSYEIIVADDCSTDLTREIQRVISGLVLVRNQENLRFLKNCNNAAKLAGGQYILFLNNDTQVQQGWLAPLVELIERDPGIGMVGSKLVYPDGRLQEAGGILWRDGSAWNYGNRSDPALPEFNYVKEADYISGASIMIRRTLWEEIGGFDERFAPAYCEDSDLAFTVRQLGYKVMYQPLSVVVHFEGASNGTDLSTGQKAYQTVNQKKFFEKWQAVLERDHFENAENVFLARERGRGKKVLLMIDHYVPMYDKDAGSRTVFQYIKLFVDYGYHVKFIGDNFYQHQPYTETLQQMGVEVLYGPYYAAHWNDWLAENGDKIGFAFLNRPHISVKYIDEIRRKTPAKIIYYGHDLHFLREQREYELLKDKSILKSAEEWRRRELSLMRRADISYYPSSIEVQEVHKIAPEIPARSIPAYLFENVERTVYRASERHDMLFIGGFGHRPNVDAVKWLAQEIMPELKKLLPSTKVYVLGSNPPEEVAALEDTDIRIVGFVTNEQLEEYYHRCRIALVPLRYGAGIKGKVVEAMRYGVPVVTTAVGAEGILGAEEILRIADTPLDFAKAAAELYGNSQVLADVSRMELAYIKKNFSPENAVSVIGEDFDMGGKT